MEILEMASHSFSFLKSYIPKGNGLHAEILGVDNGSYFHIAFCDISIQEEYEKMLDKMQACVRGRYCMPIRLAMRPGSECIVEYSGRRGGVYVRGRVIELIPGTDRIKCELIDDFLEVDVHRTQIYHTNTSITNFPRFSLRCKLEDMDIFLDYPFLKMLYNEYMRGEWKPSSSHCTVKVLERDSAVPTVRVSTTAGKDLTDVLQQYIPTAQRLEYPAFGINARVKITHCDAKGQVWFQPWKQLSLSQLVKSRLAMYNDGYIMVKPEGNFPRSVEGSWRDHYLKGDSEIYIYKTMDGKRSYRVRELSRNKNGTISAFYLDYGNTEIIREDRLVPARLVDPNLCFIPPQCIPVRFVGASCTDDDIKPFNLRKFWKYCAHQPVSIVLKEFSSGEAAYLQKDRQIPAHYIDPNLNFLPPPCIPVKFINDLGSVCQQFVLLNFWTDARGKPVSSVLNNYGIQQGQRGKFQGGIIPPEADILVNLHPDLDPDNQRGVSLYKIYHTLEVCLVHGEKSIWPDFGKPTPECPATTVKEEVAKEPENGKTAVASVVSEEITKENFTSWLDAAMKAFRTEEDDSVSSSSPLSSKSTSSPSPNETPHMGADINNNWWCGASTDFNSFGFDMQKRDMQKG